MSFKLTILVILIIFFALILCFTTVIVFAKLRTNFLITKIDKLQQNLSKYLKEINNINFRNVEFDEYMTSENEQGYETALEDRYYENSLGIPDISWICGEHCSDEFKILDNFERKILIKYYLEDYNDKQIAEVFGLHHNTVNQRRKGALKKIASYLHIPFDKIKRSRKSGIKTGL